ncbi:MAG: division/cell wall cluster transcriptional repressor MraZ [Bacteroidota bacterium]
MPQLLGEYDCKIDAKGRMRMPSQLLKQLGEAEIHHFVVKRGNEKCLVLYPRENWLKVTKDFANPNPFDVKRDHFIRSFHRGATEISTDSADRILLSKRFMRYANLEKEVILNAYNDKIEIWDEAAYEEMMDQSPEEFATLADEAIAQQEKREAAETKVSSEPGGAAGWTSDQ